VSYQTGRLHYSPRHACVAAFDSELQFFGISSDAVADCCYADYEDRRQHVMDRLATDDQLISDPQADDMPLRERMWRGFRCPRSSTLATVFYYVTGCFIAVSVVANIAETIPCSHARSQSCGEQFDTELFCVDTACVLLFTVEYALRLYASPARCHYALSAMSLIDIASILPYYVALCFADSQHVGGAFVTLRVFRVFRVFKFSRHCHGLRALGYTLRTCVSELAFLLFSLSVAVIVFGTVEFYVEKDVTGTAFTSIPRSLWYTVVTMTTLG